MSQLKKNYKDQIAKKLMADLGLKSAMQIPKMEKIVLSVSTGEAVKNPKLLNAVANELALITGQKAVITKAKKALANFKLREGMPLGVMVTLRRDRMWAFLEKFVHISLPAVRDFRGVSPKGFDGHGNFNMGIKEQLIFPEIEYDKVEKIRGMNITFCTSTNNDAHGKALLEAVGFPFKDK